MQHAINSRLSAVRKFIEKVSEPNIPEELRSYMCRFGSVLICGTVERCVEVVLLERLSNRAQPRIISFFKSYFQRGTNYDCAAIEQLLARFDLEWSNRFSKFVESNPDVKEGLSSCYAVRNSVAHGGMMSVGIERLKELFESAEKAIDALVECTR